MPTSVLASLFASGRRSSFSGVVLLCLLAFLVNVQGVTTLLPVVAPLECSEEAPPPKSPTEETESELEYARAARDARRRRRAGRSPFRMAASLRCAAPDLCRRPAALRLDSHRTPLRT
jgi:hypothetical protein